MRVNRLHQEDDALDRALQASAAAGLPSSSKGVVIDASSTDPEVARRDGQPIVALDIVTLAGQTFCSFNG